MSEVKFTPGPWSVVEDIARDRDVNGHAIGDEYIAGFNVESGTKEVVSCEGISGCGDEERANAHLIAAAPDLYEALNNVMSEISSCLRDEEYYFGTTERFDNARAALAKARGES